MKNPFNSLRIRTRLLVAYVGILLVGFAALALVAGQQISSAARADYEQRLVYGIRLIAQGIRQYVTDDSITGIDPAELIAAYEAQMGGTIVIISNEDVGGPFSRSPYSDMPEVETATRGGIAVTQRKDNFGNDALFTAAPLWTEFRRVNIVQLSVPLENLRTLIWQRWASLFAIFAVITALSLLAALTLSRSIIRPLEKLRESAVQLSQGDFSHRVDYGNNDEIGEVALAFNEMAHQVESMLEEQRAFASNTSHELRTPLTTIRLRTEALRYEPELDDLTTRQYIVEIDDEINRLTGLLEDLTLLSRLDAGRAELGNVEIDLTRFAHSLVQRMQPQANFRGINIHVEALQEELPVRASLNHLTVVFRNLLDNAIKYTPDGGTITWCIRNGEQGVLSTLQDTGSGISAEQLPHLFERFYRADKARSRNIPGTGLGLAIVKSVIEAYGGRITLTSKGLGHGTTASVLWPHSGVAG